MKLPWIKFFCGDWASDPQVSRCSPVTRGIWIDLLCAMHTSDSGGELSGTLDQLARVARCTSQQLRESLDELENTGTANVTVHNELITVKNRRLQREFKSRNCNRLRQGKHRSNGQSNAKVTVQRSEVRVHSTEERETGAREPEPDAHIPTLQEFTDRFAPVGIPKEFLEAKFSWFEGNRAWLNNTGKIKKWEVLVAQWWASDREKWTTSNGHAATVTAKPEQPSAWQLQKQKEALTEQIQRAKLKGNEDPHGLTFSDPEDLKTYRNLCGKRRAVNDQIAKGRE